MFARHHYGKLLRCQFGLVFAPNARRLIKSESWSPGFQIRSTARL